MGAFALDFTAVLAFATLEGPLDPASAALLSETFPQVETALIAGLRKDDD